MKRKFWDIKASTTESDVGELMLYGNIGPDDGMGWLFDEVSPKMFKSDLDALGKLKTLNVMINSDGGDVFAGQAIHSILKRVDAEVVVHIDGLAASIASVIAMAGDRVVMPRNAMMMIHDPWIMAMGNANEFRDLADTLDKIRESLVAAYIDKTGMDRTKLIAMLDAETWMTADEAVEMGFADEVESTKKIAASIRSGITTVNNVAMDHLSRFRHVPDLSKAMGAERDADAPTKREAERALRDVGFGSRAAKSILHSGWRDAPMHEAMTGSHVHEHPANGSQGGDAQHNHLHSHDGDYSHSHSHEASASAQYMPEPYERQDDELVECPECMKFNESDANYCDQCGFDLTTTGYEPAAYEQDADETVMCPRCKRANDDDARYCDQCGFLLAGSDAEAVDDMTLLFDYQRTVASNASLIAN